uniref:Ankyrin repeat containing protein,putative n=1 Tax=Toxoplasma gondii (strain ATCC 50861 / VEG) TaxID=432359 RepID=A0A0F7V1E8_TOXGV|nr:TPA: Ankyrin repeat containing protein,putative [Toxoplasma gondii VEG]
MSGPLLFQAIRDSNREQLVLLLEQAHANVNHTNANGTTPLILAAQLDRASLVEILLANGADSNAQERLELGGNTALHYAAKNGNREVAVLLLSHGAQANVQDKLGRTPLHTACRYGSPTVVQALLSKGADPSSRDYSGEPVFCKSAGFTPSYWAKVKRHEECASLLPPPQFYGSKQISDFQLVTMDALELTLNIPSKKTMGGRGKGKKTK